MKFKIAAFLLMAFIFLSGVQLAHAWTFDGRTFSNCSNITIIGDGIAHFNDTATANLTNLVFYNTSKDVIISSAGCGLIGSEIQQRMQLNGSSWVWTTFKILSTEPNTNVTYAVYSNTTDTQSYNMLPFYGVGRLSYNGTYWPNQTADWIVNVGAPTIGYQYKLTPDTLDFGYNRINITTFCNSAMGDCGALHGEDYAYFYNVTGSKTQGTMEAVYRVVAMRNPQTLGSTMVNTNSMITMEGFNSDDRFELGLNETSVTTFTAGEAGWIVSNLTYHWLRIVAGSYLTAEAWVDGIYRGNVTCRSVGALYRNLWGDGGTSPDQSYVEQLWSWISFNDMVAMRPLNVTLKEVPQANIIITMTTPLNKTYNTNLLWLNVTNTSGNIQTWWYIYNGNNTNITFTPNATFYAGGGDGAKNISVWANDSTGATNNQTVYFTVDTSIPQIILWSPQNITYNETDLVSALSGIHLNITSNETINASWYSMNNATNVTFTANTTIYPLYGRQNNITVWVNDSAGNVNQTTVFFTTSNFFQSYTQNQVFIANYSNASQNNITWTISKFSDGNSTKNLTFSGQESKMVFINIPKYSNMTIVGTNASMILTGKPIGIYNETFSTGTLNTTLFRINGNYTVDDDPSENLYEYSNGDFYNSTYYVYANNPPNDNACQMVTRKSILMKKDYPIFYANNTVTFSAYLETKSDANVDGVIVCLSLINSTEAVPSIIHSDPQEDRGIYCYGDNDTFAGGVTGGVWIANINYTIVKTATTNSTGWFNVTLSKNDTSIKVFINGMNTRNITTLPSSGNIRMVSEFGGVADIWPACTGNKHTTMKFFMDNFTDYVYTSNIKIDSNVDGINDYSNTTNFTGSEQISLNQSAIENCLSKSEDVYGIIHCPLNITSSTKGIIQLSSLNITFTQQNTSNFWNNTFAGNNYEIKFNQTANIGANLTIDGWYLPNGTATKGYWDFVQYSPTANYIDTPNITMAYGQSVSAHNLTDNTLYNPNIEIKKSNGAASDNFVITDQDTPIRTYYVNNTGVPIAGCNLSLINMTSYDTSLSAYATFNETKFTMATDSRLYFTMALSNIPAAGTVYQEMIYLNCTGATTSSMAVDLTVTHVSPLPEGGGGGGGGTQQPIIVISPGNWSVLKKDFILLMSPGTAIESYITIDNRAAENITQIEMNCIPSTCRPNDACSCVNVCPYVKFGENLVKTQETNLLQVYTVRPGQTGDVPMAINFTKEYAAGNELPDIQSCTYTYSVEVKIGETKNYISVVILMFPGSEQLSSALTWFAMSTKVGVISIPNWAITVMAIVSIIAIAGVTVKRKRKKKWKRV